MKKITARNFAMKCCQSLKFSLKYLLSGHARTIVHSRILHFIALLSKGVKKAVVLFPISSYFLLNFKVLRVCLKTNKQIAMGADLNRLAILSLWDWGFAFRRCNLLASFGHIILKLYKNNSNQKGTHIAISNYIEQSLYHRRRR